MKPQFQSQLQTCRAARLGSMNSREIEVEFEVEIVFEYISGQPG